MTSSANLRRFLFELPSSRNFAFDELVRREIRSTIYYSLSAEGQFSNWLFPPNKGSERTFSEHDGPDEPPYHHPPCSRIFRKGEPIYRCLTCGFDETCALCSHCFVPENHKDHKVHINVCQRENGGVCDCGDPEAWVKKYECPWVKYEKPSEMPPAFQHAYLATLEALLDFVIDVMVLGDSQYSPWEGAAEAYTNNSALDPAKYLSSLPQDPVSPKYYLMVHNDQVRHFRDAVRRIRLASGKVQQFAEMVAERTQSFGVAKVISLGDIKMLEAHQKILSSTGLASCIRNHRDVFREDMCDEILVFLCELTETDFFKTNLSAKNLLCQAFACRWKKGLLADTAVNGTPQYVPGKLDTTFRIPKIPLLRTPSAPHWGYTPSRWNCSPELCASCGYDDDTADYDPHSSHWGSRFQYLVYLDIRFWKLIRLAVHLMLTTSVITNLDYKYMISAQYVDIYPQIADMFLTVDREPEHNIMSTLSTQLFTGAANSTNIIMHGDLLRIFATIYGFLSYGRIESPNSVVPSHEVSMASLKNRRWGQIFFDIGYILARCKVSEVVLSDNIVHMACDILALFQGRPVLRRESKAHIEFENSDYAAFFHAIAVIYQFAEFMASRLVGLDHADRIRFAKSTISFVLQFLNRLEENNYPKLEDDSVDIELGPIKYITEPKTGAQIRNYSIHTGKVSFLHPLHAFLSRLIELSGFTSHVELQEALPNITNIVEYPIRTVVLMSQIKSGFWVRNGTSVRTQLQLYRNTGLRESGYLRDLFLIQVFVNCVAPDVSSFLLLNRWLLLDSWDYDTLQSTHYDQNTLVYMVDEFMNFLIHIMTEDLSLKGLQEDLILHARLRKEIIQNLCFGPMNYTRLCSGIPDHLVSQKLFDIVLEELSEFTPPTGPKDVGIYRLKDTFFDEVDPYYFDYSTNTKEDAIKLIKERIHKKTLQPLDEIVVPPRNRGVEELGIYRFVGNYSASSYFTDFLSKTLRYVLNEGIDKADSLLENCLYLIHLCSLEDTVNVDAYGSFYHEFLSSARGSSIANLLYRMLYDEEYKAHHATIRAVFQIFQDRYLDLYEVLGHQVGDFDALKLRINTNNVCTESEHDRKRRIAKERQAKLMAKFKKQQCLFLEKNKDENIDSDTEMQEVDDGDMWKFPEPHCILCQNASEDAGPFGIITYISKSSEFRSVPFDDQYWFMKAFSDSANLDGESSDDEHHSQQWLLYMAKIKETHVIGPGFTHHSHVDNKLVSLTCGHGMHFQCYMNFLNSHRNRLSQITRNSPENIEHREFLCPLCKAINNMFVPILWTTNKKSLSQFLAPLERPFGGYELLCHDQIHDPQWYAKFTELASSDIAAASIISPSAYEMIGSSSTANATVNQQHFRVLLSNMFQILSLLTFPQIFKADSTQVLVNSIKSAEISVRGTDSYDIVLTQLSNNTLINLRTHHEFRSTSMLMKIHNWVQAPSPNADAHVKLLASLLTLTGDAFNTSIVERDFFELLVNVFPLPSLGFSFNAILHRCFLGHVIQTGHIIVQELLKHNFYVTNDYSVLDVPCSNELTSHHALAAAEVFRRLRTKGPVPSAEEYKLTSDPLFGKVFYLMVLKAVTPFLRRAAIFSYVCCAELDIHVQDQPIEADKLCGFMNLNPLATVLEEMVTELLQGTAFASFLNFLTNRDDDTLQRQLEYPGVIKLIDLPDRLDFFFTKFYYSQKYYSPHTLVEEPAICLFCSEVVDLQKTAIGSRTGQCTTHFLKECSNSVGIFLIPKERSMLLLHKNGGSFYQIPYMDQHGELSTEPKKAKTVFLMKPRYDEFIRKVWLQHNVPNFIVRKLDSVMDAGGWETL